MKVVLSKATLSTLLWIGLIGASYPVSVIASTGSQSPFLIATAYTDQTLPTLRIGDGGEAVKLLQDILLSNGFLGAAGKRLGIPSGVAADGIFGVVTESAVEDLQQRYNLPVTGVVDPATWEVLDMHENPYRSPLPWQF